MCAIVRKHSYDQSEQSLKDYAFGFYLEFVVSENRLLVIKHMNNADVIRNEEVIAWLRKKSVAFSVKKYDRLSPSKRCRSSKQR